MPTPVQPRLPRWILPLAVLVILLLGAAAVWGLRSLRSQPAAPPRVQPRRTVVVFPFENADGNPDTAYFADAMTTEVAARVALLQNLSVLSHLPRDTRDPRDAARQLGADLLLQGSARREAGRGRLSAKLLDTTTGDTVWSESLDRPLTEAYDYYLRGRAQLFAFSFDLSLQMLTKSLEMDPNHTAAYALLAQAHAYHYRYVRSDPARLDQAALAAERALQVASDLPETQLALAIVGACQGHWDDGLGPARKALDIRPTDPWTQLTLSWIHANLQPPDPDQIRAHAEEALRFAPELGPAYVQLADGLMLAGRFSEANAALQRALTLMPDNVLPHLGIAKLYLSQTQYPQAQQELDTVLSLTPEAPLPLFYLACLNAVQGQTEQALIAWEAAIQKGFHDWDLARRLPYLESIRTEDRFQALLPK